MSPSEFSLEVVSFFLFVRSAIPLFTIFSLSLPSVPVWSTSEVCSRFRSVFTFPTVFRNNSSKFPQRNRLSQRAERSSPVQLEAKSYITTAPNRHTREHGPKCNARLQECHNALKRAPYTESGVQRHDSTHTEDRPSVSWPPFIKVRGSQLPIETTPTKRNHSKSKPTRHPNLLTSERDAQRRYARPLPR